MNHEQEDVHPNEIEKVLPEPQGAGGHSGRPRAGGGGRRPFAGAGRTREGLYDSIDYLKILIATGDLHPRQAQILLAAVKVQLECLEDGPGVGTAGPSSDEVKHLSSHFRRNPELLRAMAPSMKPEVFKAILESLDKDESGPL